MITDAEEKGLITPGLVSVKVVNYFICLVSLVKLNYIAYSS